LRRERERERVGHLKISAPPVPPWGEPLKFANAPLPRMLPTIKQQQKIKTSIFFRPSYPVSTYHGGKRRKKRGGISKNNLPNLFARALSVGQVMLEVGTNNENKTRGLSHCGLAIYIKKYLKAREEL
jgi:hypothetical protein